MKKVYLAYKLYIQKEEGNGCKATRTLWVMNLSWFLHVLIEIITIPRPSGEKLPYKERQRDAFLSNSLHALSLLKIHEVFQLFGPVLNKVYRQIKNN